MFWYKKESCDLYDRPERIAQGYMIGMLSLVFPELIMAVDEHTKAGAGYVDIILTIANEKRQLIRIVLELKVFEKGHDLKDGIDQTFSYLESKKSKEGYRIIFCEDGQLKPMIHQPINGTNLQDIIIKINPPIASLKKSE